MIIIIIIIILIIIIIIIIMIMIYSVLSKRYKVYYNQGEKLTIIMKHNHS